VDPLSRRLFWRLIDHLSQQGTTVLVTTHYLDEAEHCHRIAVMNAGKLAALGTTGELKRVFDGRAIVEVQADDTVEAMRALDAMPDIEKTSLFGTTVHAVVGDPHLEPAALLARLKSAGIGANHVEQVEPSLEDVFLDVVERTSA
jgi:drug efflux transport system ATP-binding protein